MVINMASAEYQRQWRLKNLEHCRQWKRNNYKKNRSKILKQNSIYQHNNLDKKREYHKKRRREQRYMVLKYYSNGKLKCNHCGIGNYNVLVIDHINDNGSQHRKKIGGGGEKTYNWLIQNKFPHGFQVLCHNCNWLKQLKTNTSLY